MKIVNKYSKINSKNSKTCKIHLTKIFNTVMKSSNCFKKDIISFY